MREASADTGAWLAIDWGTTQMRLWHMSAGGDVMARHCLNKGMGQIAPSDYERILLDLAQPYLPTSGAIDVIICGMAGSRQGWYEAPYAAAPCPPPMLDQAVHVPTEDARLNVHILPGIKQIAPDDVMRGEETQIAGVLAQNPDFSGVVCLPGTHTKWALIENGVVARFVTFMSGELFSVIGQHSVLRHSIAAEGWAADAFDTACKQAVQDPNALMASLFSVRAQSLLSDLSGEAARATLSGLLLGAELSASRGYWHGKNVVLVGEDGLSQAYAAALKTQGVTPRILDSEDTTLNGLREAQAQLLKAHHDT